MGHKCFISYKKEDKDYKDNIIDLLDENQHIDKSLDRIIDSEDGDYIMHFIANNQTPIIQHIFG